MRRTNIYLADEQCEALDALAVQEGVSRAELIRRIVDAGLAGDDEDREGDLAAIENSFGVLEDLEPAGRGDGDRSDHLDRVWRVGA